RAASHFELIAGPHLWAQVHGAINDALAGSDDAAGARAARARIAGIWPPDRAPTDEAILDWIVRHHPFRSPEMEGRLVPGARQMLSRAQAGSQVHGQVQP